MTFIMYTTQWCGYCKRLKRDLNDAGVHFEEVDIEVVADAAANNYRFSAIVTGIVKSVPFQMRKAAAVAPATQSASIAR